MVTRVRLVFALVGTVILPLGAASAQHPPCLTGCGTPYAVSVTPDGGSGGTHPGYSGNYMVVFTIQNTGTSSDTYTLGPWVTGNVVIVGQSASSLFLASNASGVDTVTYSTAGSGTGVVGLTATGSTDDADQGTCNVTIGPQVTILAPVAASGRAVVHNRQPVIRASYAGATYALDTTAISLTWRGTDVTTLARFNHGLLEWEVDSAHWLGIGDSAQAAVQACDTRPVCTTTTIWVVLLNDHKPVLGFNTLPLETPGAAFSAPFGPGLSVTGADVGTGLSTPAYTTRGAARSAGLVYSTRTSYPRALVPVEVELPWPNGTPTRLHVTLLDGSTRLDSLVDSTHTCVTGTTHRCRIVLQGNFANGSSTVPTRKWLTVQVQVDSGSTTNLSTDSLEVVVVDRRHSVYGSGWWPAGVSQLVGAGSDRVLVSPDGTAAIYRGVGDSVYLAPPGVFTRLAKAGNMWELHPRGAAAKVVFDSLGRVVRSVDAHGNADTVVYSGSSTQVTELADPFGHHITFGYAGGVLTTLTDPGSRQTKVVIDGTNHVTADTIPSANGHTYFTTFAYHLYTDSGLVLTSRTGVLGDATTVTYDTTFTRRPTKVTLASVDTGGGSASPMIQYAAAESQGFHTLAATSADAVTVTDPRGNSTTSQVNRWGAAQKTWDALDTLARTSFTPEGLVQWTEGKVQDSSRVTTVYDNVRRPVKSYVVRGAGDTLRVDSLVYDTASRVITSIDARGKASHIVYDSYGDVTQAIDPNADTSRAWFKANGLLDSTRAAGDTVSTRYAYESTWQNVDSVFDPTKTLVAAYLYDNLGRDTATDAKVRVQIATGSSQWQWRRTETFFNPINQPDSTRLLRTANCNDPCNSPPAWPSLTDSTAAQRVVYKYDRAGRDSLRIGSRYAVAGDSTGVRYVYDLLGRVRSRHPWWGSASSAVKDSFVVDIAGNVKRTITRRGDTLSTAFDSRNRDTSTVIPGVGTLRHTYAGPADQLSREAYTGLVDSIGGINPTRAWVFDKRGRLTADTGYTGSTARVTTYVYDHNDRDSVTTDAVGTAFVRYESVRGLVDTVIAATGDTITYFLEAQGQPGSGTVRPGGHAAMTVAWGWDLDGSLASLTRATSTSAGTFDPGSWYKQFFNDVGGGTLLGPIWTQQPRVGVKADTLADTVVYDGWQRVTSWYERKDGTLSASESYSFDRDGNLSSGASEAYDALTDHLTSRMDACGTWNYSYDNAGNLIQGTCGGHTWTYTYDALNQLRSLRYDGTLIARYAYDAEGRRIAKRVYSGTTGGTVAYLRFYYHGANVAFETDSGGTLGNRYAWTGTDQLAAYTDGGGGRHTVVTDLLGSVRAQFTTDSGSGYQTQAYRPYGALVSGSWVLAGLRYGWTGREYDAELGWYYLRARYYDPGARRFVEEDPSGYGGGRNVYAYGNGSPLAGRDADGTKFRYEAYICDNCHDLYSGLDGAPDGGWGASDQMDGPGAFLFTPDEMEMWAQGEQFMAWQQYLIQFDQAKQYDELEITIFYNDDPKSAAAELKALDGTTALSLGEFTLAEQGIVTLGELSATAAGAGNAAFADNLLSIGEFGINETLTTNNKSSDAYSAPLVGGGYYVWLSQEDVGKGFPLFQANNVFDMAQSIDHEMYHLVFHYSDVGDQADRAACHDMSMATRCSILGYH